MLTLNDGRNELWQWDTGRKLTVDADCSQVHFSNKVFGRSVDANVVDGVAIIPDILLQTDKELTAWAFVGTAENGYTKISKTFRVNKRNKPSDYVFTPPEQTTIGELIERLDKIEESQDPDAIKNAVDDYLASNPIEIDETDPTVPNWAKQATKPKYTAEEVGALPVTYTPPAAPVQSVNGKTGEVNLSATDVGALPVTTQIPVVPTKVSAFENDKGYLTEHQDISGKLDASALPTAINTALAHAKASGEFDGADGKDGAQGEQGIQGVQGEKGDTGAQGAKGDKGDKGDTGANGVSATHSWNGTVLTVTSASGTSSANLKGEKGDKGDSVKGDKGDTGDTGVGISSVKQTTTSTADDGNNVITVTLTNGTTSTFTVKNGSKGSTGTAGKTPVKGTDYFTEADKAEMVSAVIAALPDASEVSY